MAVQKWIYTYHISGIGILHNFSIFWLDGSFWVEVFRIEYHWVAAHGWFNIQTQRFTVSERHGCGFFAKDFKWISFSSENVKILEVLSHIISGKSKKQLEDSPKQRRFIPYHLVRETAFPNSLSSQSWRWAWLVIQKPQQLTGIPRNPPAKGSGVFARLVTSANHKRKHSQKTWLFWSLFDMSCKKNINNGSKIAGPPKADLKIIKLMLRS